MYVFDLIFIAKFDFVTLLLKSFMYVYSSHVCPAVYFIESESVSYSMCGIYCNAYYNIIVQNY